MRISDWSSDVCSSDLVAADLAHGHPRDAEGLERLADVLPLVRLDDRGDQLHASAPSETGALVDSVDPVRRLRRPAVPTKSYADSPCSATSMPSISSSSAIGRASCRERVCPYVWI